MLRQVSRPALALTLLVGLGAGGYFLYRAAPPASSGPKLADLAQETPKGAFWWVAVEARQDINAETLAGPIRDLRKDNPEVERVCQDLEKEVGQSLESLLKIYAASGYIAMFPRAGRTSLMPQGSTAPLDALMAISLYDAAAAEALLKAKAKDFKAESYHGQTVMLKEGAGFCIASNLLLIGSSSEILHQALDTLKNSQQSLSAEARFQDATAHLPALKNRPGLGFYVDFAPIWNTLGEHHSLYHDSETVERLRALPYSAGVLTAEQGKPVLEAFLKLEPKGDFAKALLKPPANPGQLWGALPAGWGCAQDVDLIYLFDAILEVVRLVPQGRVGSNMVLSRADLNSGSDRDKQIREAFTGEVAWGVHFVELLQGASQKLQGATQGSRSLACKSNLKNLATGLEMYSTDYAGRYPEELSKLTPNYLRTLPTCPAAQSMNYTYEWHAQPDAFTLHCKGDHHGMGEGTPAYTSTQGLLAPASADSTDSAAASGAGADPLAGIALGVKNRATAEKLLAPLLESAQKIDVDGHPAWSFSAAQEVYLAFLDQPSTLLVTFGPRGQDALKALMDCASGKTPSLAKQGEASAFMARHKNQCVAQSYLDLAALYPLLVQDLKKADPRVQALLARFALQSGKIPPDLWAVQVESDGLRFRNEGSAGSLVGGLALGSVIAVPNFIKARGQSQLTACKSNCKNLATGLEMWASDHQGRYPEKLSQITPDYLRTIPTCPADGRDTYTETYRVTQNPDNFSFYCSGHSHTHIVPDGYPQYEATQGLIDRP